MVGVLNSQNPKLSIRLSELTQKQVGKAFTAVSLILFALKVGVVMKVCRYSVI